MITKYLQAMMKLNNFSKLYGLDNLYININTFIGMMITTIYITCDKNLILIYYFIKQIKKTN